MSSNAGGGGNTPPPSSGAGTVSSNTGGGGTPPPNVGTGLTVNTNTTTTTPSTTVYTPPTPIMGGVVPAPSEGNVAWVGGKPKADWSGLEQANAVPLSPNQYRSFFSQKSLNWRRTGLTTKFKKGHDLVSFKKSIMDHFLDCGMDTITYLQDPANSNEMMNVIDNHSRFTTKYAKAQHAILRPSFDAYDLANDDSATKMLLDSLCFDIRVTLERKIKKSETGFTEVWLSFIDQIQSTSVEHFDNLRDLIKMQKPSNFAGQNLKQMCRVYRDTAHDLTVARQYRHELTLHMIKGFLLAGGEGTTADNFRHDVRRLKSKLDKELKAIQFKDIDAAQAHMDSEGLSYTDICDEIEQLYNDAVDQGDWLPAKSAGDSKAPPKAYILQNVMSQGQATTGTKTLGPCHNCGKEGHLARTCTEPKKNNNNKSQGSFQKNDSKNSARTPNSWKYQAPKDGEPKTMVRDGKTFYWCAKCQRWTTTHGTDTHRGKQTANLSHQSPSAWLCHIDKHDIKYAKCVTKPVECIPSEVDCSLWSLIYPHLVLALSFIVLQVVFTAHSFMYAHNLYRALWTYWLEHKSASFAALLWFSFGVFFAWFLLQPAPDFGKYRGFGRRCVRHYMKYLRRAPPIHRRVACTLHRSMGHLNPFPTQRACRDRPKRGRDWKLKRHIGHSAAIFAAGASGFVPTTTAVPLPNTQVDCLGVPSSNNVVAAMKQHFNPGPWEEAIPRFCLATVPLDTRIALLAPQRFRNELGMAGAYNVVWDSGASCCISPNINDFVGPITALKRGTKVGGIANGLAAHASGTVAWTMLDTTGMLRTLKLPCWHVPKVPVRLLSTTTLLATYHPEELAHTASSITLTGLEGASPPRNPIQVMIDPVANIPVAQAYDLGAIPKGVAALNMTVNAVDEANRNLSDSQKELLRWHQRLAHLSFGRIKALMRSGALSFTQQSRNLHTKAAQSRECPMCAACQFGKQTRRSVPHEKKTTASVTDEHGVISDGDCLPGQRVSADHFVCSTKGRRFNTRGSTDESNMYSGGCLYIDHASKYINVQFQSHLNTHETMKSKLEFENHCRDFGVIIGSYLTDNGSSFTSAEYSNHLQEFKQISSFAGVGAHHANGCAERAIRTITSMARTMMLHQGTCWPEMADPMLWPMAVRHAVHVYNHVPREDNGLSPHDIIPITRTRTPTKRLHDLHVWGCPVYVLQGDLADGKKIPRWKARSQRHILVGISDKHHTSAPLVLNPSTGSITTKYHVVFDDWFSTVGVNESDLPNFDTTPWADLFGTSEGHWSEDDLETNGFHDDVPSRQTQQQMQRVADTLDDLKPPVPLDIPPPPTTPLGLESPQGDASQPPPLIIRRQAQHQREMSTSSTQPIFPVPVNSPPTGPTVDNFGGDDEIYVRNGGDDTDNHIAHDPLVPAGSDFVTPPSGNQHARDDTTVNSPRQLQLVPALRRSSRSNFGIKNRDSDFIYLSIKSSAALATNWSFLSSIRDPETNSEVETLWSFKATASDPDTLSYDEAMRATDREKWIEAATKEIHELEQHGAWDEVPQSDAQKKITPTTWVFIVQYVDDLAVGFSKKETLDALLEHFNSRNLKFTMEGDLTSYLGITVKRNDGKITLTQAGLIDRILEATNMQDCRPNAIPAPLKTLGSDPEGDSMDDEWNYRSVVGMLLYLSTNTRPDIALAVSQVARFSANPKKSHATAIKTLIRYLQGTKHVGTVFSPRKALDIEAFVDADFAGLWNVEPLIDPASSKSRTGYIIKLAGCPVVWKSKLMTQTATSTMHAEYIALSNALREVIPLRRLLVEILAVLRPTLIPSVPVMRCTVFEDNNACLTLAHTRRLTSLTRWLCTSLHHFWESVENGDVTVARIETTKQDADYLTKPLPKEPFLACRLRNQGA